MVSDALVVSAEGAQDKGDVDMLRVLVRRAHHQGGCRALRDRGGEARHQAWVETLAILIGVHMRLETVSNATVVGATRRPLWGAVGMNSVVRCELALDIAEGRDEVHFSEHVPGCHNMYADALSQFFWPGGSRVSPRGLATAARMHPDRWVNLLVSCRGWPERGGVRCSRSGSGVAGPWDVCALERRGARRAGMATVPGASTFSRARGRPVRGAASWLRLLRPKGLLRMARRNSARTSASGTGRGGNAMAIFVLGAALRAARSRKAFFLAKPWDSFLLDFDEARKVLEELDIRTMS